MKKVMSILGACLLSAWFTFNMKALDHQELRSLQAILAQYGHVTQLEQAYVITDGEDGIGVIATTKKGSTIQILGNRQRIIEISEKY